MLLLRGAGSNFSQARPIVNRKALNWLPSTIGSLYFMDLENRGQTAVSQVLSITTPLFLLDGMLNICGNTQKSHENYPKIEKHDSWTDKK